MRRGELNKDVSRPDREREEGNERKREKEGGRIDMHGK